jgi:AraC family L-rhamnose operon regulatory protein RhaS
MNKALRKTPRFSDYAEVYFADACEALEEASQQGEVTLRALVRGSYPGLPLPDHVAPGIRTVGYWNANRPQRWGLDWHRNEGIELTYLDRGLLTFATRDREWELRPGQVTVTRPWQEHRVGGPLVAASHLKWIIVDVDVRRPHQPWRWPEWIGLSANDLHRLTTLLQRNENPVWDGDAAIRAAFHSLQSATNSPESRTLESELRLHTSSLLLALLRLLDRLPVTSNEDLVSPKRALSMFLHEIDSHLDHQWTLEEMARACGMGRSQFSTRCRELTNMTPLEFLTFRRIERAAGLLRMEPKRAVTDIALAVGFQSSQYFATVFRRQLGSSPRQYRAASLADGGAAHAR